MPDFRVSKGSLGQVVVTGELDLATAPQLDRMLSRLSGDVIVDCRDVAFIDTAGFSALDRGYDAAMKRGATFVVFGLGRFHTHIARFFDVPYVLSSTERS